MKNTFTVAYSAKCPDCGETTYKHICPSCHNELPDSTLTSKDIIVPIVGTLAAGKSHFIGVLVKELRDRISVSFNGALEGFGDSYQRWERIYGDKLYLDKLLLPRRDVLMPLIFKFKIMKKSLFGNRIYTVTMAFFDFDENGFCYENTRHIFNKFVSNSSGIIFLIDPMQIPKVVSKLDDSVIKRNTSIYTEIAKKNNEVMTDISDLIRNQKGLLSTEKIDIPIAVVLSKFDIVAPIVPKDYTILKPSPHCYEKQFNLVDFNNVNSEVVSLIHSWDNETVILQLENNYKKYSCFATSALGFNNYSDTHGRIGVPKPHRIEDPILWLLKENGVIKGK